jgi:hypothetical protein
LQAEDREKTPCLVPEQGRMFTKKDNLMAHIKTVRQPDARDVEEASSEGEAPVSMGTSQSSRRKCRKSSQSEESAVEAEVKGEWCKRDH